jgi:hypothetical protein
MPNWLAKMKFPIISDLFQADICSKVMNYMHEHGFVATLQRIVTCTRDRIIYLESHRDKLRGMQFDNEFGLDTESQAPVEELDIDGDIARQKRHYYAPTPISLAKSILEQLELNMSDYVFIDLGSGKGRDLLLAALYPFKQTIGVELDKPLVEFVTHHDYYQQWNPKRRTRYEAYVFKPSILGLVGKQWFSAKKFVTEENI